MSFDWKSLVSTVAPVLGTALGSPLAGMAISAICTAFGLDSTSDEAVVAQAMRSATPEQLMALQNAERQFKLDMEKLGVDVLKIDADDRASARSREVSTGDATPKVMAYFLTSGFFGMLGYMMGFDVPVSNAQLVNIMVGSLGTAWITMISYFYGSSAGSAKNREMLDTQLKK